MYIITEYQMQQLLNDYRRDVLDEIKRQPYPPSGWISVEDVRRGLREVLKSIDGRIDGHSWGQEETGVNKVTILDLQEIFDEVNLFANSLPSPPKEGE